MKVITIHRDYEEQEFIDALILSSSYEQVASKAAKTAERLRARIMEVSSSDEDLSELIEHYNKARESAIEAAWRANSLTKTTDRIRRNFHLNLGAYYDCDVLPIM